MPCSAHTPFKVSNTGLSAAVKTTLRATDFIIQAASLRLPVTVVLDGHAGSREDLVVVGPGGAREVDSLVSTVVCGQELSADL